MLVAAGSNQVDVVLIDHDNHNGNACIIGIQVPGPDVIVCVYFRCGYALERVKIVSVKDCFVTGGSICIREIGQRGSVYRNAFVFVLRNLSKCPDYSVGGKFRIAVQIERRSYFHVQNHTVSHARGVKAARILPADHKVCGSNVA